MEISFPTPGSDSNDNQNNGSDKKTPEVFDDRREDYETYWATVETYRYARKLAVRYLFDGDEEGVKNSDIAKLVDDSPLAEHAEFYREQKNDIKKSLKKAREDGELPKGASLPAYKKQFETPVWDCTEVAPDDIETVGLTAGLWDEERDGTLCLPAEYEPETDDDGELVVYHQTEDVPDGYYSLAQIEAAAEETPRIGEKTLAALLANLE